LDFGSTSEALAIAALSRQKNIQLLSATFAVVDPKSAEKAVRQLKSLLFPEQQLEDAEYLKKATSLFERIRGIGLNIKFNRGSEGGYVKTGNKDLL